MNLNASVLYLKHSVVILDGENPYNIVLDTLSYRQRYCGTENTEEGRERGCKTWGNLETNESFATKTLQYLTGRPLLAIINRFVQQTR
jgi:hypothetical protein